MVFGAATMRTMFALPPKKPAYGLPRDLQETRPSSRCCNSRLFLGLERNSRYGFQSIKIVGCSSPEVGMVMVGQREGLHNMDLAFGT